VNIDMPIMIKYYFFILNLKTHILKKKNSLGSTITFFASLHKHLMFLFLIVKTCYCTYHYIEKKSNYSVFIVKCIIIR